MGTLQVVHGQSTPLLGELVVALCQTAPDGSLKRGKSFDLLESAQTCPRGKLSVRQYSLEKVAHRAQIDFVADSATNAASWLG